MSSKRSVLTAVVAAGAMACAGAVMATPSSAIKSAPIVARGLFQVPVDLKFKVDDGHQHVIHVPATRQTAMQQIVFGPGGTTGWHSHPGPAVALIKSGTFTLYDHDCSAVTYTEGQAFVDSGQGHVHLGVNPSTTTDTEVWVTYFDVPTGGSVRIDQPAPSC